MSDCCYYARVVPTRRYNNNNNVTDGRCVLCFGQEVDVPVISNRQCEAQLQQTRLGYDFKLHNGFLCAGGEEGKDACKVRVPHRTRIGDYLTAIVFITTRACTRVIITYENI